MSSPQERQPQNAIVEVEPGKRGRPPGPTAQESKQKHLDNWVAQRAKNPPTQQSDRPSNLIFKVKFIMNLFNFMQLK